MTKLPIFDKPYFAPLYYPDSLNRRDSVLNKIDRFEIADNFHKIGSSYIEHYKNVLGEEWSYEDFCKRLEDLKYLTVKYARDNETGEIIAIDFFGANVCHGDGRDYLTNAELYVMPEFRGKGIARKLVYLSFELAKQDGILNFDSLTYRVQNNDPLAFWQSVGAETSGLYHIVGDVLNIQSNISQALKDKSKC